MPVNQQKRRRRKGSGSVGHVLMRRHQKFNPDRDVLVETVEAFRSCTRSQSVQDSGNVITGFVRRHLSAILVPVSQAIIALCPQIQIL
ncbi:hypothetical protein BLNAU_5408 [Blattamonas nauphoetae]|uniref:Transposase n=1 Tax=Blattamonas nauphoetae TaxID=2049346 RepID=A0ABQ9Y7F2_9EUKA|nr:hypothetical protein BLNAU_5408 [Blattamonas nauphoetae]